MRLLVRLNLLFVAVLLLHTADHVVRQDRHIPSELGVVGLAGLAGALLSLGLALGRHERAPLAAATVGLLSGVGFLAVHLAPHWSPLSDPYPGLGLDAVSWASMLGAVAAGLALALAGTRELLRHGDGGGEPGGMRLREPARQA